MIVLVTDKPGVYKTELPANIHVECAFQYVFYGECKAIFKILRTTGDGHVAIVEDEAPHYRSSIPMTLLPTYDDISLAKRDIFDLTRGNDKNIKLINI